MSATRYERTNLERTILIQTRDTHPSQYPRLLGSAFSLSARPIRIFYISRYDTRS